MLVQRIRAGDISSIRMTDGRGVATDAEGERFTFSIDASASMLKMLASVYGLSPAQLARVAYSVAERHPRGSGC